MQVALYELLVDSAADRRDYYSWHDTVSQRWKMEPIPQEHLPLSNHPAKPSTYTGTDAEWDAAWLANQAYGIGGVPTYQTASGDPTVGGYLVKYNGDLMVYLEDGHIGRRLLLMPTDFTGQPPLITQTGPLPDGITIQDGIMEIP